MVLRLRSLRSRIVLFFVALLVLVQGVALLLVNAANEANVRATVRQELEVGQKIFQRLMQQNNARLAQAAEVLSLDFAFREAVATHDLATIESVLANHGARIGANRAMLISLERRIVADAHDARRAGQPFPAARLLEAAERNGRAAGIVVVDGQALQLAVVPVRAPMPIAWAIFGFVVDDALARDLRNLSTLDVSFFSRGREGWRVIASTVPRELQGGLRETLSRATAARLAEEGVKIDTHEYDLLLLPLESDGPTTIVAVLGRSLDEALAPSRRLGGLLIALLLGSMAASILGSVLIARGVTRPLSTLSDVTRRIEQGDYAAPVEAGGPDEVRELAQRFEKMRGAIAAREAQVLHLAHRDSLTNLPNRMLFNDRLRTAVELGKRSARRPDRAGDGPGPLQVHQRQARPPRRRSGAAAGGALPDPGGSQVGHDRTARRRRVRRPSPRHRHRRREPGGREDPRRAGAADRGGPAFARRAGEHRRRRFSRARRRCRDAGAARRRGHVRCQARQHGRRSLRSPLPRAARGASLPALGAAQGDRAGRDAARLPAQGRGRWRGGCRG